MTYLQADRQTYKQGFFGRIYRFCNLQPLTRNDKTISHFELIRKSAKKKIANQESLTLHELAIEDPQSTLS